MTILRSEATRKTSAMATMAMPRVMRIDLYLVTLRNGLRRS